MSESKAKKERWKPIAGFGGMYDVSSEGRVRSHKRGKPVTLKPWGNTSGKFMVGLFKDRKLYRKLVRRLVAEAFVPPYTGRVVAHKNPGDPSNRAANLEWSTFEDIFRNMPKDADGRRCSAKELPKFVYMQPDGRYRAAPTVGGKRFAAGVHDTVEEAVEAVHRVCNGDFSQRYKRQRVRGEEENLPPWVRKTKEGTYAINFTYQQRHWYFGTHKTLKKALRVLARVHKAVRSGTLSELSARIEKERQPSFISRAPNGKLSVIRWVDGRSRHYGVFDTREEAQAMVGRVAQSIRNGKPLKGYVKKSGLPRNVTKQDNGYTVALNRNKIHYYVGWYPTVEQAVEARDKKIAELAREVKYE
jgi:hypothetical protein